ncbi:hypothetical protein J41TS12_11150 [Paenibacillus antibioticophila]|uniref:Uncharacterized protein n=1 Tax=Paenibacillus antibioticophila TaxID=1274374 RepID=A0A919XQT8_9BACL|nr:hypothetical protein [Paenibacillus antibioticophila]GIO36254.1 hypothetical protein J41TS12_11150 [Paenibacillus antibioticophila]
MINPPGITFHAEYEPDKEKMVEALRIIKEAPASKNEIVSEDEEFQEGA